MTRSADIMNFPPSAFHRAALRYVKQGRPIFPLQPRGKFPIGGTHGFKDATLDIGRIDQLWGQIPDLNLGMPTGGASGLFVVDVDGQVGRESLAKWEVEHDPLPLTLTSATGREGGGEHRFFVTGEHNVSSCTPAPNINIKGNGGYVVVPPSIHPSGRAYEWLSNGASEFAPAPAWLHEIVDVRAPIERDPNGGGAANGGSKGQDINYWDDFLITDRFEGERNNSLIKMIGKYYHAGLRDQFLLLHAANFYNKARLKPPLTKEEIVRAVRYVFQKDLQQRR